MDTPTVARAPTAASRRIATITKVSAVVSFLIAACAICANFVEWSKWDLAVSNYKAAYRLSLYKHGVEGDSDDDETVNVDTWQDSYGGGGRFGVIAMNRYASVLLATVGLGSSACLMMMSRAKSPRKLYFEKILGSKLLMCGIFALGTFLSGDFPPFPSLFSSIPCSGSRVRLCSPFYNVDG